MATRSASADRRTVRNPRRRGRRALLVIPVALSLILTPGAHPTAADDATPASTGGSTPHPILTEFHPIEEWTVAAGFIYWYERCSPFGGESQASVKRRPVHGTFVGHLETINDVDACQTFIGPAVDESGFYYYNHSAGVIEAIYSDRTFDPPTVLAEVGEDLEEVDRVSPLAVDDRYAYWIEVEAAITIESFDEQGAEEDFGDEIHVRRVPKEGGDTETLLVYQAMGAGHGLTVTDERILWPDSDGLNGVLKASCPGDCTRARVYETSFFDHGEITANERGEVVWWSGSTSAGREKQIFHTACSATQCETSEQYVSHPEARIDALAANTEHIFFTERRSDQRQLQRLPIGDEAPQTIAEDDVGNNGVALDEGGVYYPSRDRREVLRLPLDAAAIERDISFRGWEVTQAIQNVESNDVPLVAGKETVVRVYPRIEGSDASGVEAALHGERNGAALPGSPLRPVNGSISVSSDDTLEDQRSDVDGGWLFQLPDDWTREGDDAIPLEDTTIDLRVEIDPRGLFGAPPADTATGSFLFTAKAPTCLETRPVWTEMDPDWTGSTHQSSWDQSVASTFELSESVHPTVAFIPFPKSDRLEKTEWCWSRGVFGPFCSRPYDLDEDRSSLLRKLWYKSYFGSSPFECRQMGARTLQAGIVHEFADWGQSGFARYWGLQPSALISKVPRYGRWSFPMSRFENTAMTLVHEIGHNYRRRHVICGDVHDAFDHDYPYDPCKLDDGHPISPSTHFGFDTRLLEPIHPEENSDYMSYEHPKWVSDYTWRAIFERTGPPHPPFSSFAEPAGDVENPDAYLLVSGLIGAPAPEPALRSVFRYPTEEAGDGLIEAWQSELAEARSGELYHVRLLDADDQVLADKGIPMPEHFVHEGLDELPFSLVIAEPDARVSRVEVLEDGSVLDSFDVGEQAPEVEVFAPTGGEVVEDDIVVEWQATDPDEAPWLNYTVQYSPDLGETWHPLIAEQAGFPGDTERVSLDLSGQPSSETDTALLRVLANDGYHTGIGTSQPFTVLPRGPEATISSPEDGQRFEAGEPVRLHGRAVHPDEGILPDDAFEWTVDGLKLTGSRNVLHGLAPGEYTATLRVGDSNGREDIASMDFEVAPLDVPEASEPVLDARCDDPVYGATLSLSPYGSGEVAYASVIRTDEHLWVCLQGLEGTGDYAGVQIDTDNSQAQAVQASDLGFFVHRDGTPVTLAGDGEGFVPVTPEGFVAHVSDDGSFWNVELRIDADVLGGFGRRVALAVGHYGDDERAVWPHTATLEDPTSWAQANLGEVVELTPIERIEELIEEVEGAGLSHGIERSLISKLENALAHLEAERTRPACNTLRSFVNEVEAQRGKHIPEADADRFGDAAQTIRSQLGCSGWGSSRGNRP